MLPERRAAFRECYGVGGGKCGAFTCPCVWAYCIRPTNVPPKEGEGPAFGRGQAFAIYGMALCGAYAIRPYPDSRKMIAVGACSIVLPQKQAAFRGCHGVGGGKCGALDCFMVVEYEKRAALGACHWVGYAKRTALDCFTVVACENRTAFLCPRVGRKSIRPTNDPFMGRRIQMIDRRCAFLSPAGPLGGAYAIRPYPDGRKMIAVGVCSIVLPEKRAALRGCYGMGGGKCGAFSCHHVGAY